MARPRFHFDLGRLFMGISASVSETTDEDGAWMELTAYDAGGHQIIWPAERTREVCDALSRVCAGLIGHTVGDDTAGLRLTRYGAQIEAESLGNWEPSHMRPMRGTVEQWEALVAHLRTITASIPAPTHTETLAESLATSRRPSTRACIHCPDR